MRSHYADGDHEAGYPVLSFPHSNGGYLLLNYGENMECLLEGLSAISGYIGGVPGEIRSGNTRTIVTGSSSARILILDGFGYVPCDRTGAQLLFDCLSEIHEQKSVILNTNLEFSQRVNVLYDQRMTRASIGRLTHHVELILFPRGNNRLRESGINKTWNSVI